MSEMLKVSDLHVYYGSIHAVKGVSFEVHEGEVVTLIGANGAGKSTILNTVSGLLHPRSGSILFHEKNLHGPGSGGPPCLFADDGAGKPGDGRFFPALLRH